MLGNNLTRDRYQWTVAGLRAVCRMLSIAILPS